MKINGRQSALRGLRSLKRGQRKRGLAQRRLRFHLVHQWSLPNQRKRSRREIEERMKKMGRSSQ